MVFPFFLFQLQLLCLLMLKFCYLWSMRCSFLSCSCFYIHTTLLLAFSVINIPVYVYFSLKSGISLFKGCFKSTVWALYYVRAFWVTSLASPAIISAFNSGLASDLIILVCAFVMKLHWFSVILPHPCFSSIRYYFQVLVLQNVKIFSKTILQ